MDLDIHRAPAEANERIGFKYRAFAGLGLAAIAISWFLLLIPCALWFAFASLTRRSSLVSLKRRLA